MIFHNSQFTLCNMKQLLICTLLLAGLSACSAEKKEETSVASAMGAQTAPADSLIEENQPEATDSLKVDMKKEAKEIEDLLKGI